MDSAYTSNWQGKLREQIDRNPQLAAGIMILVLAAIVLLFTRGNQKEEKPGRVIKIRERIIERPGATTIIERERAAPAKEEKPEPKKEEVKEEAKPAIKEEAKPEPKPKDSK